MNIRKAYKSEIKSILNFIWNVFLEFKDEDCLDTGLAAFKRHINYELNLDLFKKGRLNFYVCSTNQYIVGVIAVRDKNHISMLYVDGKFHCRGIASQLIKSIIEDIRLDNTISRITVNSSHYAIGFYHKLGFIDMDKEQIIDEIRFTPMHLALLDSCHNNNRNL